jgi:hypothetical protein
MTAVGAYAALLRLPSIRITFVRPKPEPRDDAYAKLMRAWRSAEIRPMTEAELWPEMLATRAEQRARGCDAYYFVGSGIAVEVIRARQTKNDELELKFAKQQALEIWRGRAYFLRPWVPPGKEARP